MNSVDYYICPGCGAELAVGSNGCPTCNKEAVKKKSWEQDNYLDGLDLPGEEDEFDYEEFKQREFGGGLRPKGIKPLWWITGIILVLAFGWMVLRGW
ncbi:MAG: hypothetical protein AAGA58_15485 [Verrucomicrobiota bacterium]